MSSIHENRKRLYRLYRILYKYRNGDLATLFFLFMPYATELVMILIYKIVYISETIKFSIYIQLTFLLDMLYTICDTDIIFL